MMGFVDDHHVPLACNDCRAMWFALGGVNGRDNAIKFSPRGTVTFAKSCVVVADEFDGELAEHRPLPLLDERWWNQYEYRSHESAHEQLGKHEPGFNRFAQAHLIAQQRAPAKSAQHRLSRSRLMFQQVHLTQHRQA